MTPGGRREASGDWQVETPSFPDPGVRIFTREQACGPRRSRGPVRPRAAPCRPRSRLLLRRRQARSPATNRLVLHPNVSFATLDEMFDLEVSCPPIEPPRNVIALNRSGIQGGPGPSRPAIQGRRRGAGASLRRPGPVARPARGRTTLGAPGRPAEGASEGRHHGLAKCFGRFRRLNTRSNPELDALVDHAGQAIAGIEPHQLRDSVSLRSMAANDFTRIEQSA